MAVSVIIPALNAAATLPRTLESLEAQTYGDWEALVVDDGSTDGTAVLAREWSRRNPRIRLLELPHGGVSAARNAALASASHPLIAFLDADDEFEPRALELLRAALDDEELAGVYGRWARISSTGRELDAYPAVTADGDLFPLLARFCVFAINTCVVRRAYIERVGGFDLSLRTCEDWDLWQRIARVGGRFSYVPECVARYHLSASSASSNALRLFTDGLLVSARGHAPDPRLDGIEQAYPHGVPPAGLAFAKVFVGCWSAGLAVAEGTDTHEIVRELPTEPIPELDPEDVGLTVFESAVRFQDAEPDAIASEWDTRGPRIRAFLDALEAQLSLPGLAMRAMRAIERRLALECTRSPVTVGGIHAARVDVTRPLVDIVAPSGFDRVVVALCAGESEIGRIELPVVDGVVPADVLGDLDATAAWRLLGHFFHETVYAGRRKRPAGDPAAVHEALGWRTFLQQLWGRESWPENAFYDPRRRDRTDTPPLDAVGGAVLEVADELPALVGEPDSLDVTVRVGGRTLGVVTVRAPKGNVSAQRLRARITTAAGSELCRLAVVRALVGRPLDAGGTLRSRLQEAARSAAEPVHGEHTVLGRHIGAPLASSASRIAWLPGSVADDVRTIATLSGQPFRPGLPGTAVVYEPGLLGDHDAPGRFPPRRQAGGGHGRAHAYGRHHFEELLAFRRDPWNYESAYERRKYAQTLGLVPAGVATALEIGCAEGHFTAELAPRVGELVAADVSEIALARARERCAGTPNVTFVHFDLAKDPIPRRFDLIVCSEVLYYVGRDRLPAIAAKLARGLRPGGALVLAHAHVQVDAPQEPGFDWGLPYGAAHIAAVLGAERTLRLAQELRTPYYRVQRFERVGLAPRRKPPVVEDAPYDHPAPEVAAHFRWAAAPRHLDRIDPTTETHHLPILMYHRIADEGPDATARWRLSPTTFAEQLSYLAESGYRTVTLDEWQAAAAHKAPLPGKAVLLTFDDGYVDFAANALPLLEEYGFGAVVAVVSDLVGTVAAWDARYGEPAPLLDWPALRELADRGVEFASHAASHTPLTALSVDEIAAECARSRFALERELGQRVTTLVYPHGAHDQVVDHLAGALGYVYGLTTVGGLVTHDDSLLALPRQEVAGDMSFEAFVRVLTPTPEQ